MTQAPSEVMKEAVRLHRAGDLAGAALLYAQATALAPEDAAAHYNLGTAQQGLGRTAAAAQSYARAIALKPDFAQAHYNLGTLHEAAVDLAGAVVHFRRAAELVPRAAAIRNNLGAALADLGELAEGRAQLARAVELDAGNMFALWNLAKYGFDGANAVDTRALFDRAVAAAPAIGALQAQAGMAAALTGDAAGAERRFREAVRLDPGTLAMIESFRYVESHRAGARLFGCAAALLDHALGLVSASGHVVEFGVFRGNSINRIARRIAPRVVHGFDSFEGLPEDWIGMDPKGSYSTEGQLPEVEANVALHAGWFEATVPNFARREGGTLAFAHIDCDLYSSTRTVFQNLGARMVEGTVLVFDEYLGYSNWREHEFRAFQEFVRASRWHYEYVGFNVFGWQAAVRLTGRA